MKKIIIRLWYGPKGGIWKNRNVSTFSLCNQKHLYAVNFSFSFRINNDLTQLDQKKYEREKNKPNPPCPKT